MHLRSHLRNEPARALADFLVEVASLTDETAATQEGLSRAVIALGADAAAVVRCDAVVATAGWPIGAVPTGPLMAVAREGLGEVPLPDGRRLPAHAAALEGDDAVLVVVRSRALRVDEQALLTAMARGLGLAVGLLRAQETELTLRMRGEALSHELRRRERLLDTLGHVERATLERAPQADIFAAIASGAADLLDGEGAAVLLADETDADVLVLAAAEGLGPAERRTLGRVLTGDGAAGRAHAEDRLVVVDGRIGRSAAMAAPIHAAGRPVGCLLVSSSRIDRDYATDERTLLMTLARHASLAIADARARAATEQQALHDPLTGLPNRTLFRDRLDHALARARRAGREIGLLICDIDDFRSANGSLGHATGDALLAAIGGRLKACVRASDTAARLGDDEFAILVDDHRDAEPVAQRVREVVARPIAVDGRQIVVSVSIGIVTGAGDAEDLLRAADLAIFKAKAPATA
jgi:diguanylate cyclase (GGDEF)-like protein